MTANQVEALEFCPDRLGKTKLKKFALISLIFNNILITIAILFCQIELKSCEYSCSNGGVCVPLKRMCKCPSSLKRYYVQETCQNGMLIYFCRDISINVKVALLLAVQ